MEDLRLLGIEVDGGEWDHGRERGFGERSNGRHRGDGVVVV